MSDNKIKKRQVHCKKDQQKLSEVKNDGGMGEHAVHAHVHTLLNLDSETDRDHSDHTPSPVRYQPSHNAVLVPDTPSPIVHQLSLVSENCGHREQNQTTLRYREIEDTSKYRETQDNNDASISDEYYDVFDIDVVGDLNSNEEKPLFQLINTSVCSSYNFRPSTISNELTDFTNHIEHLTSDENRTQTRTNEDNSRNQSINTSLVSQLGRHSRNSEIISNGASHIEYRISDQNKITENSSKAENLQNQYSNPASVSQVAQYTDSTTGLSNHVETENPTFHDNSCIENNCGTTRSQNTTDKMSNLGGYWTDDDTDSSDDSQDTQEQETLMNFVNRTSSSRTSTTSHRSNPSNRSRDNLTASASHSSRSSRHSRHSGSTSSRHSHSTHNSSSRSTRSGHSSSHTEPRDAGGPSTLANCNNSRVSRSNSRTSQEPSTSSGSRKRRSTSDSGVTSSKRRRSSVIVINDDSDSGTNSDGGNAAIAQVQQMIQDEEMARRLQGDEDYAQRLQSELNQEAPHHTAPHSPAPRLPPTPPRRPERVFTDAPRGATSSRAPRGAPASRAPRGAPPSHTHRGDGPRQPSRPPRLPTPMPRLDDDDSSSSTSNDSAPRFDHMDDHDLEEGNDLGFGANGGGIRFTFHPAGNHAFDGISQIQTGKPGENPTNGRSVDANRQPKCPSIDRNRRADHYEPTIISGAALAFQMFGARNFNLTFGRGNDERDDYEELHDLSEQLGDVRPNKLTKRQIDQYPTRPYQAENDRLNKSFTGPPECLICMNEYKAKEKVRTLTCFHEFHATCIDKWLKKNATCPVCRINLNE